jgi:hypothetical protein
MPVPTTHPAPPSDEAIAAVLRQIARYRLTVFAALRTEPVWADAGLRAIKHTLQEAQGRGLIESSPLHHQARYWRLTAAGANHLGLAPMPSGPLSEAAKVRAYALLVFCRLLDRPRVRLTAEEVGRHFPDVDRTGLPTGYYFDPRGNGCLGFARVDAGHRGRWDRIVESVRQDIDAHWQQPGFRPLIAAGRFELTVLTVFPQKSRRIHDALAIHRDAQRIRVQAVALPHLLPLLTSMPERR